MHFNEGVARGREGGRRAARWSIGGWLDGATTAGAAAAEPAEAEAAAEAAAACRFQEGRSLELVCSSSGESPARPDIANAQPLPHHSPFPPGLSLNPIQSLCTTPLCPPLP